MTQPPDGSAQSSSASGPVQDSGSGSAATRVSRGRKSKSLWPPLIVRLAVVACLAAIAILRWRADDYATVNILTFLCGVAAVAIVGLWFVFFSGYKLRTRALTCLLALLCVGGLAAAYRIDHVSGELIPVFRPRWSKRADEQLGRPAPAGDMSQVALVSTEHDFPQFLGPNRNARVDDAELNRDWTANPPKLVWRQPIGAGWAAFSVVGNLAFTLEQRGDEEFVTCYQVDSGKLVWSHGTPGRHQTVPGGIGPRSTPTVDGQRVYTLGALGEVLCLEATTGKVVWRDNLLTRYGVSPEEDMAAVSWGRAGSPLIVDDLVVVPAGGSTRSGLVSLIAYRKETGDVAWEAGEDHVSYSSPTIAVLAGVRQILIVNEKSVTGHEPETGKQLWRMDWPGHSHSDTNASQAVAVPPNRVFVSKGYGRGAALVQLSQSQDGFAVTDVWRNTNLLKTKFTNVVIHNDSIYGLSDGVLECVDLESGERNWKKGRYGQGQILGAGDVILVQAESGDVVMVEANPDQFNELGRFPALDGITWNNLCLTGKKLLVRNAEEAACYELP